MTSTEIRKDFWIGCGLAVIAAFCFGIQAPIAKAIYAHGMDVYSYMAIVRVLQCFGVGLVLHCMGQKLWTNFQDYRPVAIVSVIFLCFSWLHFSAIRYLDIAPVTMLVFLYPLILAALHIGWNKTRLSGTFLLSLLAALVGLALVLQPDKVTFSDFYGIGTLMALGAATLIAICFFISDKIVAQNDPYVFTVQFSLIPALAFSALSLANGIALPSAEDSAGWSLLGVSVCFALLGQLFFYAAMRKITALRLSLVMKLEPVISVFGAVWLLGEQMTMMQYMGVFLVVSAIFAISQPVSKTEPPI